MEYLFGKVAELKPKYLLSDNFDTEAVGISLEPGNGVIPAGAVLYRKSGSALYAPCATANIANTNNLVILRDETDTDKSQTVAAAAAGYRKGKFIAGYVLYLDSSEYKPVTAAHQVVLRGQNLDLDPMDDWSGSANEADNTKTVSVTVTDDGNGTGSASPASGTLGDEVTLSATPGSGYVLDYWEVVSGDVTVSAAGKFTIGHKAVTVKAHFKAEG